MLSKIKIAVDAMGGDNSPKKVIDGVIHHHSFNDKVFYKIFGDEKKIYSCIGDKMNNSNYEIIHEPNRFVIAPIEFPTKLDAVSSYSKG